MSLQNWILIVAAVQLPIGFLCIQCQNGWTQFEQNCYLLRLIDTEYDWKAAEAQCVKFGGHLASVHSKAENSFIARQLAGNDTKFVTNGNKA